MSQELKSIIKHLLTTQAALNQEIKALTSRVDALETRTQPLNTPDSISTSPRPTSTPSSCTSSVFLPELDYLLWITRLRDEFRVRKNGLYLKSPTNEFTSNSTLKITYGYADFTDTPTPSITHTIPSPALKRDISFLYGVDFRLDYRFTSIQTTYAKGVLNPKTGAEHSSSARCAILKTTPITPQKAQEITQNTRAQWEGQSQEAKRMRVLDDEGMDKIIKIMEERGEAFFNAPRAWSMITPRDLEATENDDWYWLSPRRIELLV